MSEVTPRQQSDDSEVFVSPADRLISSLEGTYFKLTEVADLLGKSEITLRRLIKKNVVKAPSFQIRQGENLYYLYTPDDVEELRKYYGNMQKVEPRVESRSKAG